MWAIHCKFFVCPQLQDALTCLGLCKTTLKHSCRKCVGPYYKATYLKTPHVSRVPCILQAVLVTLEEELQEEPVNGTEREKQMSPCQLLGVQYEWLQHTNQTTNTTALAITYPFFTFLNKKHVVFCVTIQFRIMEKIVPCISISELLSQIAINSPEQTRLDHPHPPTQLQSVTEVTL